MVCPKCEKKLGRLVTQDKWKDGARNTNATSSRVGQNKLIGSKERYQPYKPSQFNKCKICISKVHQVGSHYCQECAYKKAICAMCGVKLYKTKNYAQRTT